MNIAILKANERRFWISDDLRALEVWRDPNVPGWGGEFRRVFNGEFKSFKTWVGLRNDIERLVAKFNMVEADEDGESLDSAAYGYSGR